MEILEDELGRETISFELLSVILERYPLGEHGSPQGQSECKLEEVNCKEWDKKALEAILTFLEEEEDFPLEKALFDSFFERTLPDLSFRALNWVADNPEKPISKHIALAIVRSERAHFPTDSIRQFERFATNTTKPALRRIGLLGLANLNRHLPIDRDVRLRVLTSLWKSAQNEELADAFSVEQITGLDSLVRENGVDPQETQTYSRWINDRLTNHLKEDATDVELLREAIIGFLRSGAPTKLGQLQSEGEAISVNDWEYVFQPLLNLSRNETIEGAYITWVLRMAIELAEGKSVEWAADELLEEELPNLRKSPFAQQVKRFALRHCSDDAYVRFGDKYVALLREGEPSASLVEFSSAMIRRDTGSEPRFAWLLGVLNEKPSSNLVDHLLDALHGEARDDDRYAQRARFHTAALRAVKGLEGSENEQRISELLVEELRQRMRTDAAYWDAVAAIEEAGLLPRISAIQGRGRMSKLPNAYSEIREAMSWIGTAVSTSQPGIPAVGSERVRLLRSQGVKDLGGTWYRIENDIPIFLTIDDLPKEIEVALMTQDRTRTLWRTSNLSDANALDEHLSPGAYAIAFRLLDGLDDNTHAEVFAVDVNSIEAPYKLSISSRSNPVRVLESIEYLFDSKDASGEVWLEVELQEGSKLEVETQSTKDSEELVFSNPVSLPVLVGLIREYLPDSYFQFRSRIRRLGSAELEWYLEDIEESLDPFTISTISRDFLRRRSQLPRLLNDSRRMLRHDSEELIREIVHIASHISLPGFLGPRGGDHFFDDVIRHELMRLHPLFDLEPQTRILRRDVDTFMSLLRADSDNMLDTDDDGGTGVNSKISYQSDHVQQVLVRVQQCCEQDFNPGQKFILRIDLTNGPRLRDVPK